jgi:hypothetical protein
VTMHDDHDTRQYEMHDEYGHTRTGTWEEMMEWARSILASLGVGGSDRVDGDDGDPVDGGAVIWYDGHDESYRPAEGIVLRGRYVGLYEEIHGPATARHICGDPATTGLAERTREHGSLAVCRECYDADPAVRESVDDPHGSVVERVTYAVMSDHLDVDSDTEEGEEALEDEVDRIRVGLEKLWPSADVGVTRERGLGSTPRHAAIHVYRSDGEMDREEDIERAVAVIWGVR